MLTATSTNKQAIHTPSPPRSSEYLCYAGHNYPCLAGRIAVMDGHGSFFPTKVVLARKDDAVSGMIPGLLRLSVQVDSGSTGATWVRYFPSPPLPVT